MTDFERIFFSTSPYDLQGTDGRGRARLWAQVSGPNLTIAWVKVLLFDVLEDDLRKERRDQNRKARGANGVLFK